MSIKTPLSRAKGLGEASEGVSHFWRQRVTAVALIPLVLWFLFSVVSLSWKPYINAIDWVAEPHHAVFLLLLIWAGFTHMRLGLQVVIEDYVTDRFRKLVCLALNDFFAATMGITCALAVIKIFVMAAPA